MKKIVLLKRHIIRPEDQEFIQNFLGDSYIVVLADMEELIYVIES